MHGLHGRRMWMLVKPVLGACLAAMMLSGAGTVADAQERHSAPAPKARARAPGVPVREIERRVIPRVPGAQYLGFDYDPETEIYTLKFLRKGTVIWVNVNARTGRTIPRKDY